MSVTNTQAPIKIVYNNAWNGRQREPWLEYMERQAEDTDVFCLQEMYCDEFRAQARHILPDYQEFTTTKVVRDDSWFHLTTFVRPGLDVRDAGSLLEDQPKCGAAQYVQFQHGDRPFYVANVHGAAWPEDNKLDNAVRLAQSRVLLEFFAAHSGVKVIGGDFNLDLNTRSIAMFQEHGYRNLIVDYAIATTRNHFAWDNHPEPQFFADYVFASPDAKVDQFSVVDKDISDHLPMVVALH